MLLPRVIPCLLLKGQGLVKGVRFKDHRYIGDPINAVQLYNTMEVDELLFLDILATEEKRTVSPALIQKIADQCLMPFGVGGGIQTVDQVRDILKAGSEKVCLNTAALERPSLVREIADTFGRQSVVVSIDIKKSLLGKYHVFTHRGTRLFSKDLSEVVQHVAESGAGEILLNNIDRDGSMAGYDLDVIREVADSVEIPVIVCGGAGSIQDLRDGIRIGHAAAVAAGSMFVFQGPRRAVLISYPTQEELREIRG